jgi:hypothetical protein
MIGTDEIPILGCAVCNPALNRPLEAVIAENRDEVAKRMHIAEFSGGYHILEIPGSDGNPFKTWQGPFETKASASLYLSDLVDAYAAGTPADAYCSSGIYDYFNMAGRLLTFIQQHRGDERCLAIELASHRPWETEVIGKSEVPF